MSAQLCASLERLAPLGPRFASVTCGAKRHRTTETVRQIQARTNVATAPHLTCAGAPWSEVVAIARHYEMLAAAEAKTEKGADNPIRVLDRVLGRG